MDWHSSIKGFKAYLKLERSLSPNSIEAYLRDVDKLFQFSETIGGKSPVNISTEDLKNFLVWINELGMLAPTQARVLSGIKAFFKYLLL